MGTGGAIRLAAALLQGNGVHLLNGDTFLRYETRAMEQVVRASGAAFGKTQWRPLDVLTQHMVSAALGGGFDPDELRAEVESCFTYMQLTDAEWRWCLDFVTRGGASLQAYPDFHKVVIDPETGLHVVTDRRIATRHRTNIGTIVSEASITVQFLGGARLEIGRAHV